MGDHVCQFFLRVNVADRPGVLASIAKVLGDADISIDSVLQKDSDVENQSADLVIMTHPAQEAKMQDAVSSLRLLEAVVRLDSLLRVEIYPNRS
jgi:homoserine dehydrogenase